MLMVRKLTWFVSLVLIALMTQTLSCIEPCGVKREPIVYLTNNSSLVFTRIYSPQAPNNIIKKDDRERFLLPISLTQQTTTFILEGSPGSSYAITFSYLLSPEFQSNVCGYVIQIKDFAVVPPTNLSVRVEQGYYAPGWFGGYIDDHNFYAFINP